VWCQYVARKWNFLAQTIKSLWDSLRPGAESPPLEIRSWKNACQSSVQTMNRAPHEAPDRSAGIHPGATLRRHGAPLNVASACNALLLEKFLSLCYTQDAGMAVVGFDPFH